jgi:ribosome-associated protein
VTASSESVDLVREAATAASDKRAIDTVAFDVSDQLAVADAFVLCSAPNERQVRAIVEAIEERLAANGVKPAHREGERENRWVLLDYLDVVVHVQHEEERAFYSLERLWSDCPTIPLGDLDGAVEVSR